MELSPVSTCRISAWYPLSSRMHNACTNRCAGIAGPSRVPARPRQWVWRQSTKMDCLGRCLWVFLLVKWRSSLHPEENWMTIRICWIGTTRASLMFQREWWLEDLEASKTGSCQGGLFLHASSSCPLLRWIYSKSRSI